MRFVVKSLAVLLLCGAFTLVPDTAEAQTVLDGVYIKENTKTRKVIPYPYVREADVMWSRRVWQVIDVKQKMNLPLYYPIDEINDRKSLFDVIKNALLVDGSITAYSTGPLGQDDEFTTPLLVSDVKDLLFDKDTVYTEDPDTGELVASVQETSITSVDVTRYKLKEVWFFDKQRSERYVRIIGIAPQKMKYTEDGEATGAYETLFWLYYPECRYVFANWEVFNRQNDAERRSYEDIFQKRFFDGTIIKESNVYDRNINEVYQGIDALLQAKQIEQELFELEHDLWSY